MRAHFWLSLGRSALHIANLVFPSIPLSASVCVRPVDTNGLHVPADLAQKPFDDAALLARFNALQDYVFGELHDLSIAVYVVGNDVDVALAQDSAKLAAYKTLKVGGGATVKKGAYFF